MRIKARRSARPQRDRCRASFAAGRFLLDPLESRVLLSNATAIGVNLEAATDWSRSFMFVDAMKTARQFGSPATPWDGAAPVDANGWPTTDFGACVITINSPTLSAQDFPSIAGTYLFSANGTATISSAAGPLNITNQVYNATTNTTTADITVPAGATSLYLSFTHTVGGMQNIKLIRPGYAADTTQIFTTAFLNSLAPFQTLRTMDLTQTNGNTVVNWSDRAHVTDALQSSSKGVAWEYIIDLANETHTDLWINIPSHASNDYITQLATLLKNDLNSGLHVYVEYSNEVWNQSFEQGTSNYAAAQTEEAANPSVLNYDGSNNTYVFAWRRIVEQLENVRTLFANVYGSDTTTIRPVLASQIASPMVLRNQLDFLNHFYGSPNQTIYAVAGAPYLNIGSLSTDPTLTEDEVIAALQADVPTFTATLSRYAALAKFYGVQDLMYEGGIDLEGDTGGNFVNAKLPANYDPRMGPIISQFLNALYSGGVSQLMYFNETDAYGVYGTWGLTEDVNNLTGVKFAAVAQFASQPPPVVTIGQSLPSTLTGAPLTINGGNFTADGSEALGHAGDITSPSTGSTFDYLLNSQGGSYSLALGVGSSTSTGQLQVFLDNQLLTTLAIPNTGGNTTYITLPQIVLSADGSPLSAGLHVLRLSILNSGFTLHSLTFQALISRPFSLIAVPAQSSAPAGLPTSPSTPSPVSPAVPAEVYTPAPAPISPIIPARPVPFRPTIALTSTAHSYSRQERPLSLLRFH